MQIVPRWVTDIFVYKWVVRVKLLNDNNKRRSENGVSNFLGVKSLSPDYMDRHYLLGWSLSD